MKKHGKASDEKLLKLWQGIFQSLDAKIFAKACEKFLNAENFPEPGEIIAAYVQVKNSEKQKQIEKTKAIQSNIASGQIKCFLCNNSGICTYRRGDYEYAARCICAHGKDLNKFSKAEIDEQYQPTDKKTKAYIPTIKEALGRDFAVYEAQKKAQKLGNKNLSDEDKLKILQGGYELQWQNPQR